MSPAFQADSPFAQPTMAGPLKEPPAAIVRQLLIIAQPRKPSGLGNCVISKILVPPGDERSVRIGGSTSRTPHGSSVPTGLACFCDRETRFTRKSDAIHHSPFTITYHPFGFAQGLSPSNGYHASRLFPPGIGAGCRANRLLEHGNKRARSRVTDVKRD